jgi:hypothetical protein
VQRRTDAVELQMVVERGLVEELQCIDALQQACHPLLEELVEPAGVRARRALRARAALSAAGCYAGGGGYKPTLLPLVLAPDWMSMCLAR